MTMRQPSLRLAAAPSAPVPSNRQRPTMHGAAGGHIRTIADEDNRTAPWSARPESIARLTLAAGHPCMGPHPTD